MLALQQQLEALIFCSPEPLDLITLRRTLAKMTTHAEVPENALKTAIEALIQRYEDPSFAFGLYEVGGGYQFLSKPEYEEVVAAFVQLRSRQRLSRGVLETLAIIAYKQPVTKQDIEQIRGVHASYALERLLERDLIAIAGRDSKPGRPLRYRTTARFIDFFGINSLKDLPTLQEHKPDDTPKEIFEKN